MPPGTPTGFPVAQVFSEERSEFNAPFAQRLVADLNAALVQQFLNVSVAQRKAVVEPNGVLNDRHRETVAVRLCIGHGESAYPDPVKATQPLADLQMACLEEVPALTPEELSLEGALAYYNRLQSDVSEKHPYAGIAELATVTWPVQILPPDGESGGWFIREQAQAMEQWLWPIASIGSLREAVQLSVIMRNLLHWGSTDVPRGGYDLHLQHGLSRVHEVNSFEANDSEDLYTD